MLENLIFFIGINQQINTVILSIILLIKNINADYSAMTEKIEANSKALKFKVKYKVRISKWKIFLVTVTLKIGQETYLLSIDFTLKTISWTYPWTNP